MDDAGIAPQSRKAVPEQYVAGSVKRMAGQIDGGDLRIGNLDPLGIFVFVQLGAHFEAGVGCGRGNQLDDCAIAAQRLAAPIDRDEREQTVLNFVPFAGARRQVTDRDRQLEFVSQVLKLDFP